MSKIKKLFIILGVFIAATFTKIGCLISRADHIDLLYGPPQDPQPTTGEVILKITKPAILVVVFIIGLFVILSKKITKKAKVIAVSILIILAILGYVLMNYIATNF